MHWSSDGTFTETIVAVGDATVNFDFGGSMLDFEIDDLSVQQVYDNGILTDIEDWATTTLKAMTDDNDSALFREDESGREKCVDHWFQLWWCKFVACRQ